MRALSSRERKLVALLMLFAVIALVWALVVGPIVAGFVERSAQRVALTEQYQANQRIIGSIPRLRRQAERQRDELRNFVVSGPTKAAATSALQERIQRTIESEGGEIRAIEDASTNDAFVKVRASTRMMLKPTTAILSRLQNEPPYLKVEALSVTADEAVISGRLEMMEVSFDVSVPYIAAKSR
jgi:Tfp pilus assembly major pilin PilA